MDDANLNQLKQQAKQLQAEVENTEKVLNCFGEQFTKIKKIQRDSGIQFDPSAWPEKLTKETAHRFREVVSTIRDPVSVKAAINVMFRTTPPKVHQCFKLELVERHNKLTNERNALQYKIKRISGEAKFTSLLVAYNKGFFANKQSKPVNSDNATTTTRIVPPSNSRK